MKTGYIKVNILKEMLWYTTYKKLADGYPFASKQWVVNKTNEYVNSYMTREKEIKQTEDNSLLKEGDIEKESELYAQGVVGELSQDVRHLLETAYIAGANRIMK